MCLCYFIFVDPYEEGNFEIVHKNVTSYKLSPIIGDVQNIKQEEEIETIILSEYFCDEDLVVIKNSENIKQKARQRLVDILGDSDKKIILTYKMFIQLVEFSRDKYGDDDRLHYRYLLRALTYCEQVCFCSIQDITLVSQYLKVKLFKTYGDYSVEKEDLIQILRLLIEYVDSQPLFYNFMNEVLHPCIFIVFLYVVLDSLPK